MVLFIKDNGLRTIKKKDLEDRYGLMDRFMKECGIRIWQMGKEDSFIQEVMYTKGNG